MMDWVYNHLLLPVLGVLYVPCDWLLGWTERFSPIVSITLVGIVSGLVIILIQKYASNQKLLGQCKADLDFLKRKIKRAKLEGRPEALLRARALSGRIGMKRFLATLKPSMWTVPLFIVVALWADSRLGYLPVRPGQDVQITAHFEDQAKGFAYVLPAEAFRLESPPIAPLEIPKEGGVQARWTLRFVKEGTHHLALRSGGQTHEVPIPVATRGGRPPERVTWIQDATPEQDQIQAIEIKLADSLPAAWWNLKLQWGGLYLLVALLAWVLFRWLLKVN